ncbi:amino acid adenylation domain-containing protein [Streptomyces sp. 2333.5]|uniref:AMP-binding protein n=1 Tax=unclassified Streptomyces TaxID=2593676 RepID=UPI00089857BC|nr:MULTISPECIES: AMP-binding protein [unclassified Streptomyces]PJJ06163.1 amino acid adenylation domain-containing protein [Streptomyces sp. 2333.5]SEE91396.1 amino acid adenylation domain-containing protein [Streptomyces sp. 2314.4]SEF07440.1 amino acid adenylation domain-containing protein [Streptomyces sp. 2112.2]
MDPTVEAALHGRFLRGVDLAPRNDAVRVGADSISYEQAHELALVWAGALLRAVRKPPGTVAVLAAKGVRAYVGILAALYAGATVVPLQPGFPPARTRRMMQAAGVSAVITDEAGWGQLPELLAPGPDGEQPFDLGGPDEVLPVLAPGCPAGTYPGVGRIVAEPAGALSAPHPVRPADAAYVLFTSGSTGRPKGVPISHGSAAHYFRLQDERYDFTPQDVFSQTFDLNFDCAMFDLFCAWGAGATALWVPPGAYRELPAFVAENRMTVWFATPSAIPLVRRLGGLAPGALPGLRWSFFAGEALTCQDAADWQAAAPQSTLENLYGPTELTITIAAHRWQPGRSAGIAVNGVVPIGRVNDGHDHLLLGEDGQLTSREGELCVTGPQLTSGYLDPDDNTGRFLKYGERTWYRTGDRVRRIGADGELAYLGRLDSQVQIAGWRVELAEIDHALRGCEGVTDAVTVDVTTASGTELAVFYTGSVVPLSVFARQLQAVLPQGMTPRHFWRLDAFPLNSNRKTDRGVLRARAEERLRRTTDTARNTSTPTT